MKVLFVASGTSNARPSPIVQAQINSLVKVNIELHVFLVRKPGIIGYTKAIFQLKKHLKRNNYDTIHAHYSFSGIVAAIAGSKPLVVSLMGSDVQRKWLNILLKLFSFFFWEHCIVKSLDMKIKLDIRNVSVIPNGVNLDLFKPMNKKKARKQLGFKLNETIILYAANPNRPEKNYKLLKDALDELDYKVTIKTLQGVVHEHVPLFMNASNVVVLTSLYEGSPNVIKEAMACNCVIVTTNVGDTQWLLGNEPGLFLTSFEPNMVAKKLTQAIDFSEKFIRSNGRQRIIELGLDNKIVAQKIIKIYNEVLK